ncbi:hypothetical protein KY289_020008 [Solanum tuberosum]|nr:hypothetical protein KY289_020008 [Solanum tuberosum]
MGVWASTADVDVVRVLCDLVRSSEFAGDFRVRKKHAQGGWVSLVLLLLYGTLDCCLGMLYVLCGMDGSVCQRVVALALPNLQLQGTISPSLANLSFLNVLNLQNNSFRGGIPFGLGQMPRLRVIDVKNNQLIGMVKCGKGHGMYPNSVLDLTNNSLTGMILPSVGNATKMMNFILSGNRVSGNIPKEIGNLSQLADLSLLDNQLTGSIPSTLFNISSLLGVSLSFNSLSGPLLLDEGNTVSNLYFLSISDNQISGCIPSSICQLTELKVLSISFNNITGDIPRNIGAYQGVTVLLDAAMSVEYLHHGHATPIVHCDLKPANILLDEDMVAHVGDFGISKILAISKSMAYTETILGTLGYIAPEYGSEGIVSASDVYSYGIILMEVLTRRRPTDEEICNENLDLRKWITQSFSGTMMDVVDTNLFSKEEQITSKREICIASMIELGLDCTMEMPGSRISMKEVVKRLNKINNTFLET